MNKSLAFLLFGISFTISTISFFTMSFYKLALVLCQFGIIIGKRINLGVHEKSDSNLLYTGIIQIGEKNSFSGTSTVVCGGSVISENWIISAAHCFYHDDLDAHPQAPEAFEIVFPDITDRPNRVNVTDIIFHPHFNHSGRINDIALIRTSVSLTTVNPFIKSLPLATAVLPPSGVECYHVGYGADDQLRRLRVNISSIPEGHDLILVYEPENRVQQGDSGSPLICKNSKTNISTITGLVSYGRISHTSEHHVFYTNISFYLNWINSNNITAHYSNIEWSYTSIIIITAFASAIFIILVQIVCWNVRNTKLRNSQCNNYTCTNNNNSNDKNLNIDNETENFLSLSPTSRSINPEIYC